MCHRYRAQHKRWGRAFVQLGADSGQLELLDAIAEITPIKPLTVRFGRFKTPTSVNFLIFGWQTPFVNRPYVVQLGFVQQRLVGGELVGTLERPWGKASLQLGLFIPSSDVRNRLPGKDGEFLSVRSLVELRNGLGFHLAYLDLLLADNRATPPPSQPGAAPSRPVSSTGSSMVR